MMHKPLDIFSPFRYDDDNRCQAPAADYLMERMIFYEGNDHRAC